MVPVWEGRLKRQDAVGVFESRKRGDVMSGWRPLGNVICPAEIGKSIEHDKNQLLMRALKMAGRR
jgi:hypothetical protein